MLERRELEKVVALSTTGGLDLGVRSSSGWCAKVQTSILAAKLAGGFCCSLACAVNSEKPGEVSFACLPVLWMGKFAD